MTERGSVRTCVPYGIGGIFAGISSGLIRFICLQSDLPLEKGRWPKAGGIDPPPASLGRDDKF